MKVAGPLAHISIGHSEGSRVCCGERNRIILRSLRGRDGDGGSVVNSVNCDVNGPSSGFSDARTRVSKIINGRLQLGNTIKVWVGTV